MELKAFLYYLKNKNSKLHTKRFKMAHVIEQIAFNVENIFKMNYITNDFRETRFSYNVMNGRETDKI
jgi:hypothetical protein